MYRAKFPVSEICRKLYIIIIAKFEFHEECLTFALYLWHCMFPTHFLRHMQKCMIMKCHFFAVACMHTNWPLIILVWERVLNFNQWWYMLVILANVLYSYSQYSYFQNFNAPYSSYECSWSFHFVYNNNYSWETV